MSSEGKHQANLDLSMPEDILPTDSSYVLHLLNELQNDLAERKYAARIITKWLVAYDILRRHEFAIMAQANPQEKFRTKLQGNLLVLQGYGRHLLSWIEESDLKIRDLVGVSLNDIHAICEELETSAKAWSNKVLPKERTDLLCTIFPDEFGTAKPREEE